MNMTEIRHDVTLLNNAITAGQRQAAKRSAAVLRCALLERLVGVTLAIGVAVGLGAWGLSQVSTATASTPRQLPVIVEAGAQQTAPIVTDYVIFRSAQVAEGIVETGWHYASANQTAPDDQWCHLKQPGKDETTVLVPYERIADEFRERCVWYMGKRPSE